MNGFNSFAELRAWLASKPSEIGSATSTCSKTGKPYTEIWSAHLARPGDEPFAERMVAAEMGRKIRQVLGGATYIYWRIPLETEVKDEPQVVEYRDDGPDVDFLTDRKCIKDHNWRLVSAYCRFAQR